MESDTGVLFFFFFFPLLSKKKCGARERAQRLCSDPAPLLEVSGGFPRLGRP